MSQTNIHQKLIEHIIPAINEQWIVNGELSVSDYGFFVYGEGSAFPLHIDNGSTDRILVAIWAPHRKFSALFYLDDYGVDYTGGEFVIHPEMGGPIKSIEIHPTKCMMIIFPSNLYFTHEVKKIKSGRRIMFSTFLDVTPK
jgi:predicted 2-oxoglutarate/Fe(II)-dependent dioxygenase YbiX